MTKDAFDMFAYVQEVGPVAVGASIHSLPAPEREGLLRELAALFGRVDAPGTLDVLRNAGLGEEGELLARNVVDLFEELRVEAGGAREP